MAKIVTIIPARGGSKGIPKKNLVDINGKPLIYYTIKASLESNVDETWVSSEDDKILEVAKKNGAKVIKRPNTLSTDIASSESVLLHFAQEVDFDVLVFLQATSPMTKALDINNSMEMMREFDSVLSVCKQHISLWCNGQPSYDMNNRKRRQDSQGVYVETGAIYITSRERLLKSRVRVSGRIGFYVIPKSRSFELDSVEDLEIIRKLMG